MKKFHILALTLFAAFAFTVVAAGSASAANKIWLLSGNPVTVTTAVDSEGEQTTHDGEGGLFKEEIILDCSILIRGTVGPNGVDEVTEVTGLNPSTEPLWVKCAVLAGICGEAEAMAENLPWKTELELEGTGFIDKMTGTGGELAWVFKCSGVEKLCESLPGLWVNIENLAEDVDAVFLPTLKGNCSGEKEDTGSVEGSILILNELALAASE